MISLKFLGALRHAANRDSLEVECKKGATVLDIVKFASDKNQELRRNILDEQLDEPKPNGLILVNGREISVLNGLETELQDGDELVFIPVVHGG
jgi:sulfur-carrier protein